MQSCPPKKAQGEKIRWAPSKGANTGLTVDEDRARAGGGVALGGALWRESVGAAHASLYSSQRAVQSIYLALVSRTHFQYSSQASSLSTCTALLWRA